MELKSLGLRFPVLFLLMAVFGLGVTREEAFLSEYYGDLHYYCPDSHLFRAALESIMLLEPFPNIPMECVQTKRGTI